MADKKTKTSIEGNSVSIITPEFLSLVGNPANQTAFKVLRSAPEGTHMTRPVVRRTKRSDTNPLMQLTFPEGSTDATVNAALDSFGLKGYTVARSDAGTYTATRADLKSIATDQTTQIKLTEEGLMATVARSDAAKPAPAEMAGLKMTSVIFRSDKISADGIDKWLKDNGIEAAELVEDGTTLTVQRSVLAEGEETRKVELEPGITAVVARDGTDDIPDGYMATVNEACYGNWGWGHLDFSATLADVAFSEQSRDSIESLEEVLRNIVCYSSLPLTERKSLANKALEQFGVYIGNLLDSLPSQVLVAVARSANLQSEKEVMTQASKSGTTATPAAAAAASPFTAEQTAAIAQVVRDAIAAAAPAAAPAAPAAAPATTGPAPTPTSVVVPVETAAAPTAAETAAAATTGVVERAAEAGIVTISRADLTAAVSDALKPMADRLEKLEGTTIVRSATGAEVGQTVADTVKAVERGAKGNVFTGSVFPMRKA